MTLKANDFIKIQLGAQIDGFGAIVCDTIVVPGEPNKDDKLPGREADLLLATYWANELLLRLMLPRGLLATGTDDEKAKAGAARPITQSIITTLLQKVAESYGCSIVESTTCWLFERNEIEGKKKIVLAPGEGVKGEGVPEVGEVWGVEIGVSMGSGKVKTLESRPTLHRRTTTTYGLKRQSSRQTLSEIVKKFGTFPFSLRQLDDERAAKVGVVECVRGNVLRQYEVVGDKDGEPVARVFSTVGKSWHILASFPCNVSLTSATDTSSGRYRCCEACLLCRAFLDHHLPACPTTMTNSVYFTAQYASSASSKLLQRLHRRVSFLQEPWS